MYAYIAGNLYHDIQHSKYQIDSYAMLLKLYEIKKKILVLI